MNISENFKKVLSYVCIMNLNNSSKIRILNFIEKNYKNKKISILDIGCGSCLFWKEFLKINKNITFYGVDINEKSLYKAKLNLPRFKENISKKNIRDFSKKDFEKYDLVISNSALEHIYKYEVLIKFLGKFMQKNSLLLINWDYGHFRTGKFKINILNKLSEILAFFGFEKYYTKEVDLIFAKKLFFKNNFKLIEEKFSNLYPLKGLFSFSSEKDYNSTWIDIEEILNNSIKNKKILHKHFYSVFYIFKKK